MTAQQELCHFLTVVLFVDEEVEVQRGDKSEKGPLFYFLFFMISPLPEQVCHLLPKS